MSQQPWRPRFKVESSLAPASETSNITSSANSSLRSGHTTSWRDRHAPSTPQNTSEMYQGLGQTICELSVENYSEEDIEFTDVKSCGGYRWLSRKDDKLAISVPGIPDRWIDAKVGKIPTDDTIQGLQDCPDSKSFLVHGSILLPLGISSFEPLLQSLSSSAELDGIDIITSRNVLRKLFALFAPAGYGSVRRINTKHSSNRHTGWVSSKKDDEDFRIDAEIVGDAILLHRWEPEKARTAGKPNPTSPRSYHIHATSPSTVDAPAGSGTDRIVRYNFGGIGMMVRFDVSAYIPNQLTPSPPRPQLRTNLIVESEESKHESDDEDEPTELDLLLKQLEKIRMEEDEAQLGWEKVEDGSYRLTDHSNPIIKQDEIKPPVSDQATRYIREARSLNSLFDVIPAQQSDPAQDQLVDVKIRSKSIGVDLRTFYSQMVLSQIKNLYVARHDQNDYSAGTVEKYRLDGPEFDDIVQEDIESLKKLKMALKEIIRLARKEGEVSFIGTNGTLRAIKRLSKSPELSPEARQLINSS